jgi:putative flippase GtrA
MTAWLARWRYLKFGLVGASGTVVNLGVLYVCQELLLQSIEPTQRLYASLALAILLATVNNFFWNRRWTWQDRLTQSATGELRQFARYCLASWLGTCVQYVLTLWLATHMHYMPANVLAIVAASFVNYFANDWWTFQTQPRLVPLDELRQRYERVTLILLLLALVVYAFDLGGENIPRNGDELVYAHIAFKTWLQAQHTGAWLPLASDLGHMRNTKPPLLFWQAMGTAWLGLDGQLLWLRVPSLLYTFATTGIVVWAAQALTAHRASPAISSLSSSSSPAPQVLNARSVGHLAGLFFLAFFSTYRYGRPYLTSAIETFWMGLPVWWWLRQQLRVSLHDAPNNVPHNAPPPTRGLFVLAALSFGAVALYKSFVLMVPVAGTLLLALCWQYPAQWRRWIALSGASVVFGLACFGLWFALDPDPQSVWREFVIGENLGKMDQGGPSYWQTALTGGFSIWWQALALPQNALLLAPVVAMVLVQALSRAWPTLKAQGPQLLRGWRDGNAVITPPTAVLWWYVAVVTVFFMLPSQRSSRYLIPLMPVVAVLCATRIWQWSSAWHRWALGASTLLSTVGLGLLGLFLWTGWRIDLYPLWGRMGLCLLLALQVLALLRLVVSVLGMKQTTTTLHTSWVWLLGWVISLYAWFGLLSAPLHTAANRYSAEAQHQVAGLRLAVPSYFNGDFERWRFLLPQVAQITPYPADTLRGDAASTGLQALLRQHDAVVVHGLWHEPAPDCAALGCTVVQARIALRGRHKSGEVNLDALHTPENVLFWREYLLVRQARHTDAQPLKP